MEDESYSQRANQRTKSLLLFAIVRRSDIDRLWAQHLQADLHTVQTIDLAAPCYGFLVRAFRILILFQEPVALALSLDANCKAPTYSLYAGSRLCASLTAVFGHYGSIYPPVLGSATGRPGLRLFPPPQTRYLVRLRLAKGPQPHRYIVTVFSANHGKSFLARQRAAGLPIAR